MTLDPQQLARTLRIPEPGRAAFQALLRGRGLMAADPAAPSPLPASGSFRQRLRERGATSAAWQWGIGAAGQLGLGIIGWWVIGVGALEGHLEPGRLAAWALLLATVLSLRALSAAAAGRLAVAVGAATKERLLDGILRLAPESLRNRGVGQLLGIVIDVEALETLARAGGPLALMAIGEIVVGSVLLVAGVAPGLHLALLAIWIAVAVILVRRYARAVAAWGAARLALTHDLVEAMVGYRTRAVQLAPERRHEGEAEALAAYDHRSASMDEEAGRLSAWLPRLWLVLGVLGLAPAFVLERAPSPALAVSVGGLLLVYLALRKLSEATPALAAAVMAWRRCAPFFGAPAAPVIPLVDPDGVREDRPLVVGRDVSFSYPGRASPVLRACRFDLRRGDRVLLEGGSGAGKSTLGSLIAGLRWPDSGALLLGGLDHQSLGEAGWRRRAGSVPQFHDNHVLSASVAFNVLMGRRWPPTASDARLADEVLRELGLGDLLDRMPAGLWQMVGDSGWQLSHGERARLFLARSLLQPLQVRVLDESLAALDPRTLGRVLDVVLARSETLVVVAHT